MMTEKGKPQAISAFVVCLMLFSLSALKRPALQCAG